MAFALPAHLCVPNLEHRAWHTVDAQLWKGGGLGMEKLEQGGSKPQGSENSLVMGQRRRGEFSIKASLWRGGVTAHAPHPPPPVPRHRLSSLAPTPHSCWVRMGGREQRVEARACVLLQGVWGGGSRPKPPHRTPARPPARLPRACSSLKARRAFSVGEKEHF